MNLKKKVAIIINGYPGSGKDTFISLMQEVAPDLRIVSYSTIDPIKDVARTAFGWNGEKTPKYRNFLAELKQVAMKYTPYSENCARKFYSAALAEGFDVMFITAREPGSYRDIEKALLPYCQVFTVFIQRDEHEDTTGLTSSDCDVEHYNYNCVVRNCGTLDDLRTAAETVAKAIKEGNLPY